MKVAVINFSGNVGKSTIARHLLFATVSCPAVRRPQNSVV